MMFYDARKRYQGTAGQVTQRTATFGGLIVMDIVGADKDLAGFLARLDRKALAIHHPEGAALFTFRWASGYENGAGFRVQGMLEPR